MVCNFACMIRKWLQNFDVHAHESCWRGGFSLAILIFIRVSTTSCRIYGHSHSVIVTVSFTFFIHTTTFLWIPNFTNEYDFLSQKAFKRRQDSSSCDLVSLKLLILYEWVKAKQLLALKACGKCIGLRRKIKLFINHK